MPRTWVFVEDDAKKCRYYVECLLSSTDWLLSDDRIRCITRDKSGDILSVREAAEVANEDVVKMSERFAILPVRSSSDLQKCFDAADMQKELLVLLDVEMGAGIQTASVFKDKTDPLNRMWRKLHVNDADRNLIIITTAEKAPKTVVTGFRRENPKRFNAGEALGAEPSEWEDDAKLIIASAHRKWLDLNDPTLRVLRSVVSAQSIPDPGHPNEWNEVPEDCELKKCFEDDANKVRHFTGVFCYGNSTIEDESADGEQSSAVFVNSGRHVRVCTVMAILRQCGFRLTLDGDEDEAIQLPGVVGGIFLWRFVRFLWRLDPRPEELRIDVGSGRMGVSIDIPGLSCFEAVIHTRGSEEKVGGMIEAYRDLIVCKPPTKKELDEVGAPDSSRSVIERWHASTCCHGTDQDASRGHCHPMMQTGFIYGGEPQLRLSWRYRKKIQQSNGPHK